MEIAFIFGILAAFALGAYIRKPFPFVRKEIIKNEEPREDEEAAKRQEDEIKELNAFMNYTPEKARGKHEN